MTITRDQIAALRRLCRAGSDVVERVNTGGLLASQDAAENAGTDEAVDRLDAALTDAYGVLEGLEAQRAGEAKAPDGVERLGAWMRQTRVARRRGLEPEITDERAREAIGLPPLYHDDSPSLDTSFHDHEMDV